MGGALMTDFEQLQDNLTKLRLANIRRDLTNLLDNPEITNLSLNQALLELTNYELKERAKNVQYQRLERAHFPYRKTLRDYNFEYQPAVDEPQIRELESLRFMSEHKNIILMGSPGVGKTHIAIALGIKAIESGHDVMFITIQQMIQRLQAAKQRDSLEASLKKFRKVPLLIIDEIGFMDIDEEGSNLFFQIINERYETASTIVTTNLPLSQWSEKFSKVQAAAILDRLVHHSVRILINGKSYRLNDFYRTQTREN
jgi:DNA replication protein DnaC